MLLGEDAYVLSKKYADKHKAGVINSTNLFNPDTVLDGYNTDGNGQPVEDDLYGLSDFIKVTPRTNYTVMNVSKVVRYDANKERVSQISPNPNTPTTITSYIGEYLRLVILRDRYDIAQINKGDELLPFEPYGKKLDPKIIIPAKKIDMWASDRFVIDDFPEYTSPTLAEIAPHYTTSEFIGLYDNLMSDHPDYITKTTLGTDSLGEGIYRYDFKPEPVPTHNVNNERLNTKIPKMILISGVHGEEKAGAYNLYNALKQIAESWETHEQLETLRWNVHFIIIPIVNNYGWTNATRKNENGVDLARNFPTGWELNTSLPDSPTYGGETPLSENGAQIVAQILDENKDAIYFTSHHSFGANLGETGGNYIWNASATKLQVNLGKKIVSKMTRKWRKEYTEWMPTDGYIGYSDQNSPNGSEGKYAASLGIQASTFETSDALPHETSRYSSLAITLGTETFVNWLILNLRENVKFYNGVLN